VGPNLAPALNWRAGGQVGRSIYGTFCIAGVLVVCVGSETLWAQPETQALTVLAFNYSRASDSLVTQAEKETSRVFSDSGIKLSWIDCAAHSQLDSPPMCTSEAAPAQIRLRILDRNAGKLYQGDIFGFATAPVFASVYYESALRLAATSTDSELNVSILLGCLIAHEIGHLLLGPNRHAASGIMRASWDTNQVKLAMMGSLLFMREQSKLMLKNVQLRINVNRASNVPTEQNISPRGTIIQQTATKR